MEYKRDNIKAHIEPTVFDEVVRVLKDYQKTSTQLYAEMRENHRLNHEIGLLIEKYKN